MLSSQTHPKSWKSSSDAQKTVSIRVYEVLLCLDNVLSIVYVVGVRMYCACNVEVLRQVDYQLDG